MAAANRLEPGDGLVAGRNDRAGAQTIAEHGDGAAGHRDGGLAGRDAHVALSRRSIGQGAARQLRRIARTDTGPDNVQDVVAEPSV
jgi:hypothetical protein